MAAFAGRLNDLAISQWMGTVVEVQQGYVPPPLDGVWARYPYLHNQSVPTLCDMLTPGPDRPEVFWMGPADDPETDFDMAWRLVSIKRDSQTLGRCPMGRPGPLSRTIAAGSWPQ
ncbi:MAG: hypothetical protein ACQEXJ_05775 [Myxococcota bacterium]